MNYIFKPTPENFKRVQEKCFEAGVYWSGDWDRIKEPHSIEDNRNLNVIVYLKTESSIDCLRYSEAEPNITESEFLELDLSNLPGLPDSSKG